MGVVVFVAVAAAQAAVLSVAPHEAAVARVVLALPDAAAVVHAAPVVISPDPVLCEPAAAVVVVELPRVAAVAVPAAVAAAVAGVVAPQHVHLAAAVALVAPDVQLSLHLARVQLAVAGPAHCQRCVVVAQQHDLSAVPLVAIVRPLAVVPQHAAVPLFVLPAAAVRHCLDPGPDPDARLAPGTSVL